MTYYHANRDEIDAEIVAEVAEGSRIEALYQSQTQIQSKYQVLEMPSVAQYPSRREFMKLPIEERRRILAEQAEVMLIHYQDDREWQELQRSFDYYYG
ncbi:hypothetical protein [Microcoleus sp. B4-D4]|uniref:hypothetical protein n=1 Tax=Microcoleus sp. B4-D4 TaxID=2818667 RepID=UPI002FD6A569